MSKSKKNHKINNFVKKNKYFLLALALLASAAVVYSFYSSAASCDIRFSTAGCPTIKYGSRGTYVKYAQRQLNFACSNTTDLVVDGVFGSGTLNVTKAYQRAHGLTADGIIGSKTWYQLNYDYGTNKHHICK